MNNKKKNKYTYLKVLQMLYDGTWYDVIYADKNDKKEMADFRVNIKAYRENTNDIYRVISRREQNN